MIRKSSRNIDRSLRYTKHLSKIKSFTLDEELDLFTRWSDHGDVAARNVLVESAMKVAVAMACRYRARYHDFDELLSAGTEGVMHALRKFDPTMRKRFSSYAWHWVRAYVGLVLIQEWSITGGRGILRSNKLYTLIKVRRRIQASVSDRDDVIDQIASELKTTPDQVRMWVARLDGRDSSLDYEFEDGRTMYDTMPSSQFDPEKLNMDADRQRYLQHRIELAMQHLTPRQRRIIERRYMSDEPCSLNEIGLEQGVTRERIRQIEVDAFDRLRDHIVVDDNRPAKRLKSAQVVRLRQPRASKPSLKSNAA